jgi:hypothetical protein
MMPPEDREMLTAMLKNDMERFGFISNSVAAGYADMFSVTERTVRRVQRDIRFPDEGQEPKRPFGAATREDVLASYYQFNGNIRSTFLSLRARGLIDYSESTFGRRLQENFDLCALQFPFDGDEALHDGALWLRTPPKGRNELWEMDYTTVKARVVPPGAKSKWIQPELGFVVDAATGVTLGFIVCEGAHRAADGVAAIAASSLARTVRLTDGRQIVLGGKPGVLLSDNDSTLVARAMKSSMSFLDINYAQAVPYSGWQKPNVENLNGRFLVEASKWPGATRMPSHADGSKLFEDLPLLSWDAMIVAVWDWVEAENNRPRAEFGGLSPLEMWAEGVGPLEQVSPEDLRVCALVETKPRKVTVNGINFKHGERSRLYAAPGLKRGDYVVVKYLPNVPQFIEVYDAKGENWICRAAESNRLNADERAAVLAERQDTVREIRAAEAIAGMRRAEAGAQMEASVMPVVSRVVDAASTEVGGSPAPQRPNVALTDQDAQDDPLGTLEQIMDFHNGQTAEGLAAAADAAEAEKDADAEGDEGEVAS